MDNSPTQNVGCIIVDLKTNTIWVGNGEVNSSRSLYAGIGILKSDDNGKYYHPKGDYTISIQYVNLRKSTELNLE
jgi:hypothetical protein